jgi:formylmethanofuran dehydrogenase subunit E
MTVEARQQTGRVKSKISKDVAGARVDDAVTGARLGKRTLKFLDHGKVAATFLNLDTGNAVRIVARESARDLADRMHPEIENKKLRQMITYREATDADLFSTSAVAVTLNARWTCPGIASNL